MYLSFHSTYRKAFQCGLAIALLSFAIGCGEKMATISGIVELDGKPMKLADNARGTVMFQPASRQGATLNGLIKESGKFELVAGTNSLVSPGVYVATVSAVESLPSSDESAQPGGKRITPDKYASSSESGLRVVIKPGENHVVLKLESDVVSENKVAENKVAEDVVDKSINETDQPAAEPDSQEANDKE